VAGSGKTSFIVSALSSVRRTLILTYTDNNVKNLKQKIYNKFGYMPENIVLLSYFTFLYSFCFKPFLWSDYRCSGINWEFPPEWTSKMKRTDRRFYIDGTKKLYHNRIAKLLETEGVLPFIIKRLEKYYDCVFIDEIQDFGGHDFNFLKTLAAAKVDSLFVGDFYQHTFDTSRDGNINTNLHESYEKYKDRFCDMGLTVDENTLVSSYRCSPTLCDFVSDSLEIRMRSHRTDSTIIDLIDKKIDAERILICEKTVKLFYQKHSAYHCYSRNWGESKGDDHYDDVCVVLNETTLKKYHKNKLQELPSQTRNKLYVACTRTRNNLYFLPFHLLK